MQLRTYAFNKSVRFKHRDRLPAKPGIYYAVYQNKLLYIGRSSNLRERWGENCGYGEHHKLWAWRRRGIVVNKIRLYYWLRPSWRLDHDEAMEIKRFRPPDNKRQEPTNPFISLLDLLACVGICWAIVFVVSRLV